MFVERTCSETAFIADDAGFYDNELEKRPYPNTANILQTIGADLTPTYPVPDPTNQPQGCVGRILLSLEEMSKHRNAIIS